MSLNLPEILQTLGMSQLTMVVPALGESYAGNTASLVGALLLANVTLPDRMLQTAPELRRQLEQLLGDARLPDPALQQEIARALADPAGNSWFARQDVLLQAFASLHQWADANDAALARQCRAFLVQLAESELIEVPAADPAPG